MMLTVKEIKDLATLVCGLKLCPESNHDDPEDDNTEIMIEDCPQTGVVHEGDETERRRWQHIAYLLEYPDEGVVGIGRELEVEKTKEG